MVIPLWQKIIGAFLYMLPWHDALPFGRNLFISFPYLEYLAIPTLPIIIIERSIPFGSFLLFLIMFIAVIRNPKIAYFVRFNALQALLLNIGVILVGYAFQVLLSPFAGGLIARTLASTVFLAILAITIFAIKECLQGKEAEIPAISEAVKMQLH